MPHETVVTRCGNCGAPLERGAVESARCSYCHEVTWLGPVAHATRAAPRPAASDSLHDRLMRGPQGEPFGRARRLGPAELSVREPASIERALWPSSAEASSTFGGSWSPSSMLGPPRVYPNHGDIAGAWAPGPARSPVEWVEVRFRDEVPVTAVRVFETHHAGSVFAVVDTSGDGERLLWAGAVEEHGGARVLEVAIEPPRVVREVRAYLVNRGWSELDTVGLVAAAPLPHHLRVTPPRPSGLSFNAIFTLVAMGALALVVLVVFLATRGAGAQAGPDVVGGRAADAPPAVSSTVPGARMAYAPASRESLAARGVVWASTVDGVSSEYSKAQNAAADALGPPDVFPGHGDVDGAWASRETDAGYEWITVRFPRAVRASAVLWVETFHPGAVVRVDDLSDPGGSVALWQGRAPDPGAPAAVAEVTLPAPREVTVLRVVLDTRLVAGWNELDAIGLVPASR